MIDDEIPNSIRVRTDESNRHRYRVIRAAARFYDVNMSDAVAFACDDVVGVAEAVEEVLNRSDLTRDQREAIADIFDERTRGLDVELEDLDVDVTPSKS